MRLTKNVGNGVRVGLATSRLNRDGESKVSVEEITSVISFASNLSWCDSREDFSLAHVRCCSIWLNSNLKTLLTQLGYLDVLYGTQELIGIHLRLGQVQSIIIVYPLKLSKHSTDVTQSYTSTISKLLSLSHHIITECSYRGKNKSIAVILNN